MITTNFLSCSHMQWSKRSTPRTETEGAVVGESDEPSDGEKKVIQVPQVDYDTSKEISLILGPGGWRFFAHAGVLSELHRAGFKVQFIGGLEKSALPAMLYADSPGVSQVEWQLFKLTLEEILKTPKIQFRTRNIDQFQVPFSCPSYSLIQRRSYILNRGLPSGVLSMCYEQFVDNPNGMGFANPVALDSLIEVAARYSEKIVFVDIISQSELETNADGYHYALWSQAIMAILKRSPRIDIISIPLQGQSRNFNLRQSWMREGAKATLKWIQAQGLKP